MKLENGMYIRTKSGEIDKIVLVRYAKETQEKYPNNPYRKYWRDKILLLKAGYWRTTQNIVKMGNEIIELIDIGDFVNGYKIVAIEQDYFNGKLVLITEKWETNWQGDRSLVMFHNEDICSVLTKEQYENTSYKVEREED